MSLLNHLVPVINKVLLSHRTPFVEMLHSIMTHYQVCLLNKVHQCTKTKNTYVKITIFISTITCHASTGLFFLLPSLPAWFLGWLAFPRIAHFGLLASPAPQLPAAQCGDSDRKWDRTGRKDCR